MAMERLDPDEDPEDQPSPAQSGQDGDEAQSGEVQVNYNDAEEEAGGWDDEDAASGSDQVVLQPGSSGQQRGMLSANAQEDQVDDGDPRPGPSSCSQQVSGSTGAGDNDAASNVPDEGSNSADFWAASSSGGGQSGSVSRELSQDNSPGSEAAAAGGSGGGEELPACSDAAVGPNHSDVSNGAAASSSSQPSQSPRVVVSLASFSPQPSSSSSNYSSGSGPSSAGGAPSQSSSVSFSARNGGGASTSSLAVSSTGASSSSSSTSPGFGLSSSSVASPNSVNRSTADAPSASSAAVVVSLASDPPLLASSSSSSFVANPQPASPVPSGSQSLHGEISNPPSPLGGSRPTADPRRAAKRDYPDSPIPGPSGINSSAPAFGAKRPCQDPQPGSSGVAAAPADGASEAAAAVQQGQDEDEDENGEEMSSAASSSSIAGDEGGEVAAAPAAAAPSYSAAARSEQPLTPADNFMISSSTGMGLDSIPPTPVDIHGDNDLSVPSPGVGLRPQMSNNRRGVVSDDAVDSTVDSTGIPLTGGMSEMEYEVRLRTFLVDLHLCVHLVNTSFFRMRNFANRPGT